MEKRLYHPAASTADKSDFLEWCRVIAGDICAADCAEVTDDNDGITRIVTIKTWAVG